MNLMDSINAGVNSAMKAAKNGTENYKAKAAIAEQERIIEKMTSEIGNLVIIDLDNGTNLSPAVMERYAAIKAARDIISEIKIEKPEVVKKVCPSCGKKSTSEMDYCGHCGTKLEVEVEKDDTDESDDSDKPEE